MQEEIERLETCLRAEERKHKCASSGGHAATKLLREEQAKILLLYEKKGELKGQLLLQPRPDDVQNLRHQQSNLLEHQHRIIKHAETEMAMRLQSSLQDAEAQALESENTLLEQAEQKVQLLRKQTEERLVALEWEKTLLKQKAELLREQERLVALEFQLMEGQEAQGVGI
jgi:vacuolar-type H+-ATPase subunit H